MISLSIFELCISTMDIPNPLSYIHNGSEKTMNFFVTVEDLPEGLWWQWRPVYCTLLLSVGALGWNYGTGCLNLAPKGEREDNWNIRCSFQWQGGAIAPLGVTPSVARSIIVKQNTINTTHTTTCSDPLNIATDNWFREKNPFKLNLLHTFWIWGLISGKRLMNLT